jgi:hypothetical protein
MNLNREEFLLLAHTGRGPHLTRAGPGPDERFEAEATGRRFRKRGRGGLTLRRGRRSGLRHVLGSRGGPQLSGTPAPRQGGSRGTLRG